jgi:uncharacterized membrane protein
MLWSLTTRHYPLPHNSVAIPVRPRISTTPGRDIVLTKGDPADVLAATFLLLALAAVVVLPLVMGGTGMKTSVGMYPGMMGGYLGVSGGTLAGGVMMVALWALAIAGAVLLVRWLTEPEPAAADVLRQRYAAGDITHEHLQTDAGRARLTR